MKKNLKDQINNLLKLNLILLFCLLSCKPDNVLVLYDDNDNQFTYIYQKDTIRLFVKNINTNDSEVTKYVKINGDYYENGDKDKLFFSINKDTLFYNNDESDIYKIKIHKNRNETYQTTIILENYLKKEIVLRSFYYDKNYRIFKIQ